MIPSAMEDKEEAEKVLFSLGEVHLEEEQATGSKLGPDSLPSLLEVEEIIEYEFKDKRLLQQAFMHASYQDEDCESYERLEYIGDSVLNLLIAREHFFSYPELSPGKLTQLRAANVDTEKLARAAIQSNLHKYLRHKKPLLHGQIGQFMEAILKYPLHSHGLIDAPKALADVVESTIGAVFIDSNSSMDVTWKIVRRLLEPTITLELLGMHPMTKLYEICQKNGLRVCFVDLWKETGTIKVFIDNEFIESGVYIPKKEIAINRAANNAYNELVKKLCLQEDEGMVN